MRLDVRSTVSLQPARRSTAATGLALALGAAALVVCAIAPAPASAQGWFGYSDDYYYKPRKVKKPRRVKPPEDRIAKADKGKPEAKPVGPLVIVISLRKQNVAVYDANGLFDQASVSSGRPGYPTPTGIFTILEKDRVHYSNLYGAAPMPNMQRLTWSGVALHHGPLPGYAASHGCVRLPYAFSRSLFGYTSIGARVIVSRDAVAPVPFTHANLFRPLPPDSELDVAGAAPATTRVASADDRDALDVPSALGVTTAAAAEGPAPQTSAPSLRARLRQARAAEKHRLMNVVSSAEAELAWAGSVIEWQNKSLNPVKADMRRIAAAHDALAFAAKKGKPVKDELVGTIDQIGAKYPASAETAADAPAAPVSDEAPTYQVAAAPTADSEAQRRADEAKVLMQRVKAKQDTLGAAVADAALRRGQARERLLAAKAAQETMKRAEARHNKPVSVFISRKTGRLYVRQAWAPIFDAPVEIQDKDRPLGSHVFTALAFNGDKTDVTWSVVSIPAEPTPEKPAKAKRDKRTGKLIPPPAPKPAAPSLPQTAADALARISIPPDVRERIEELVKPGSSLVVSDYGIGNETGEYTDIIVQTR